MNKSMCEFRTFSVNLRGDIHTFFILRAMHLIVII